MAGFFIKSSFTLISCLEMLQNILEILTLAIHRYIVYFMQDGFNNRRVVRRKFL